MQREKIRERIGSTFVFARGRRQQVYTTVIVAKKAADRGIGRLSWGGRTMTR